MLLLLTLTLINIFIHKKLYIDIKLIILWLGIFFQQMISLILFKLDFAIFIKNLFSILLIIIITSISHAIVDKDSFFYKYRNFAIFCTLIIIAQSFVVYVLKKPINAILLLPQSDSSNWVEQSLRPMSLFTEPQTYCSFIFPAFLLCYKKKDYFGTFTIFLGIFLSGSSLGIMMIVFLGLITFFKSSISFFKKCLIFFGGIFSTVVIFLLPIFSFIKLKILSLFMEFSLTNFQFKSTFSYTNYLRLIKGWVTFYELPLKEKIVGLGLNNLTNYMEITGTRFSWSKQWAVNHIQNAYFNSSSGIFIECGLVIGILYYYILIKKIKIENSISKNILIFIIFQGFATQIFFNSIFIFWILMYYIFSKNNFWEQEKEYL